MAHDNYLRMISQSLDAALTTDNEAILMRHIDECAACNVAWESMNSLDRLLMPARMVRPSPGFSDRVMARVQLQRTRRKQLGTSLWWILGLMLTGLLILQPGTGIDFLLRAVPAPLAVAMKPVLDFLIAISGALSTQRESLRVWFTYIASVPVAWITGLVVLALVATSFGLVGMFVSERASMEAPETSGI